MKRIPIDESLTYVVPGREADALFLGCSGLVVRDRRVGIIDGNMGPEETAPFLDEEKPDVCVVSHFHIDHSRWGPEAARIPGVTLHVPEAEWRYLADVEHFVERCGLPEDMMDSWHAWLTEFAGLRPVPDAVPLSPGDVLDLGATKVEVIDAAGHSLGHQAYWIADRRILFCVDIGVDSFGPWYGWQDSDLEQYVRSIHRLASMDAKLLVTSHGGLVDTDIRETLLSCLEVLRKRERLIAADLDAGLDIQGCTDKSRIYGDVTRFPPPFDRAYAIWEKNMVGEHVRLIENGGVDAVPR